MKENTLHILSAYSSFQQDSFNKDSLTELLLGSSLTTIIL